MMDPTSALVFSVFKSCWENFFPWKGYRVSTTMSSLHRPAASMAGSDTAADSDDESTDSGPRLEVTLYDSDEETTAKYALPIDTIEARHTKPHSKYTSCSPAARNVIVGDDSNYMPFIPFEDDVTFDHEALAEHYDFFRWQNMPDPDVEIIAVQAVKTLISTHKLTLPQILATNIVPPSIISYLTSLLGARRRDYPIWPPDHPLHHTNVPYEPDYTNASPSEILDSLLRYFCTTCHHGYCSVHTGELPLPPAVPPAPLNETKQKSIEQPCGKNCFLLGQRQRPSQISLWSDEDAGVLDVVLKYGPDSSACDLAVIIRKPCNEVEIRRKQWLTSQEPSPPPKPLSSRSSNAPKIDFQDLDSDNFTPNYPCSHLGPCDASTDCPCYLNYSHCIGACKCSKKCPIKWRGCNCTRSTVNTTTTKSRSSRTCGTTRCPCFRAHRECDPGLCIKCEARNLNADNCRNSSIQHMQYKRGVTFPSRYGLGFYLTEQAREGDLITEYIGDLIYDATSKSRDPVAAHNHRQYMFKLNSTFTVDGGPIGNESRYINHASGDKANVQAHVRLVNGDHRIGIFAVRDIEPGEELFLDYGSDFFRPRDETSISTLEESLSHIGIVSSASPSQRLSLSLFNPFQPARSPARPQESVNGKNSISQ